MKLVICPIQDPHREIDLTHCLVSAIAEELWRSYGGNDELNWLEAELHLRRIIGDSSAEAVETEMEFMARRTPTTTRAEPPTGRPPRLDPETRPRLGRNTVRRARAVPREPKPDGVSRRLEASARASPAIMAGR
jgi:hypothetical protein